MKRTAARVPTLDACPDRTGAGSSRPLTRRTVGAERREQYQGIAYAVRSISGQAATKAYRCPGCDQEIRPGVAHLVCWPADNLEADDRRHWHSACWAARHRRAPGVQRTRAAPRY